jgi:hypothetical protein
MTTKKKLVKPKSSSGRGSKCHNYYNVVYVALVILSVLLVVTILRGRAWPPRPRLSSPYYLNEQYNVGIIELERQLQELSKEQTQLNLQQQQTLMYPSYDPLDTAYPDLVNLKKLEKINNRQEEIKQLQIKLQNQLLVLQQTTAPPPVVSNNTQLDVQQTTAPPVVSNTQYPHPNNTNTIPPKTTFFHKLLDDHRQTMLEKQREKERAMKQEDSDLQSLIQKQEQIYQDKFNAEEQQRMDDAINNQDILSYRAQVKEEELQKIAREKEAKRQKDIQEELAKKASERKKMQQFYKEQQEKCQLCSFRNGQTVCQYYPRNQYCPGHRNYVPPKI